MAGGVGPVEWWADSANIEAIRDFAHMSGLLVKHRPHSSASAAAGGEDNVINGNSSAAAVSIRLTLQPTKFPEELYREVWSIQPVVNELLDTVSRDQEFLEEALDR